MDSRSLQVQLDVKQREHDEALRKLEEAEQRVKAYEAATQRAYEEVGQMQSELEDEQRCLETAVRVASELYSKNTELKKRTTRRTIGESQRRKAWKEQFDKEALRPPPEYEIPEDKEEGGSDEDEGLYDDIEEIAVLDKRTKSDLEKAINDGNSLRKTNREISWKLSKFEAERREYETTIEQLQAVVKMKDDEIEALKEKYDVESQVRQRAETYAAKMYGKNKAFQRKSVMMKSRDKGSFEEKLESTMKDYEKLTEELEEERMCHKQEVQKLEEQLQSATSPEATKELENKISLLTIEIDKLKARNSELEEKVLTLENEAEADIGPPPSAPPPPPPVPPPPPMAPPPLPPMARKSDPAEAIYELIAERKATKATTDRPGGRTPNKSSTLPAMNSYSDAMDEMMRRIKSGIALKKASTLSHSAHGIIEEDADISEESSDEYDEIYSQVGSAPKRSDIAGKAATLGRCVGINQQKSPLEKPSGVFNRAPLKPVKNRNSSTADANDQQSTLRNKELQQRDTPLSRQTPFQDSVKVPKDINPDLKRILEKRRMGMKKAQNEAGTS